MAKKRYTKLEEEIIQILNEQESKRSWRPSLPRIARPRGRRHLRPVPPISSGRRLDSGTVLWLGVTFGLALGAILVADWSRLLAVLLSIAAILYFLSPMVRQRTVGPPPRTAQRWRGRDIELPPSRAGLLGDLRYRIWQMRHRR